MAPILSATQLSLRLPLLTTPVIATPLWIIVSVSLLSQHRHSRTSISTALTVIVSILLVTFSVLSPPNYFHPSPAATTITVPTLIRQDGAGPTIPPVEEPVPTPTPSPSTIPSPSPSPSPATIIPPAANPAPTVPQNAPSVQQTAGFRPSRDRCAPGLQRMQAVLLLELCFEFLFLFMRCFADKTLLNPPSRSEVRNVDISFRGYLFVRAIYAIFVVILNCAIYWIGGGPTGSCLTSYGEVQTAFAHLIFYVLYSVFIVVIGIYRIDL